MEAGRWSFELPAPYSLAYTVQFLRRRPNNAIDQWLDGCYVRGLATSAGDFVVQVRQEGTRDRSRAVVDVSGSGLNDGARTEITALLRSMLGLDVNLAPLLERFAGEGPLSSLPSRFRGMRPPRFATLIEAIASVVPFQQLSLAAGVTLLNQLVMRFGQRLQAGERSVWVFPSAPALADAPVEALRVCGFSAAKSRTLTTLARQIAEGRLAESQFDALPTAQVLTQLVALPGIGPWSAAVIALRGLGRLDAFPRGDSGMRATLMRIFGRSEPLPQTEEEALLARLGPARGLLYFYTLGWRLSQAGVLDEGVRSPLDRARGRSPTVRKPS